MYGFRFTTGAAQIDKVLGIENPAGILTKHVEKKILDMALQMMGVVQRAGRLAVAPQAASVQNQLLNKRHGRLLKAESPGKEEGRVLGNPQGIGVSTKVNSESPK